MSLLVGCENLLDPAEEEVILKNQASQISPKKALAASQQQVEELLKDPSKAEEWLKRVSASLPESETKAARRACQAIEVSQQFTQLALFVREFAYFVKDLSLLLQPDDPALGQDIMTNYTSIIENISKIVDDNLTAADTPMVSSCYPTIEAIDKFLLTLKYWLAPLHRVMQKQASTSLIIPEALRAYLDIEKADKIVSGLVAYSRKQYDLRQASERKRYMQNASQMMILLVEALSHSS